MKIKTENIPSQELKAYCQKAGINTVRYVGRFAHKDGIQDRCSDMLVYVLNGAAVMADASGLLRFRDLKDFIVPGQPDKTPDELLGQELLKKDVVGSWA